MIEAAIFLLALYGVVDGAVWMARHELARRRAAKVAFPPMRTLEIADEIPF